MDQLVVYQKCDSQKTQIQNTENQVVKRKIKYICSKGNYQVTLFSCVNDTLKSISSYYVYQKCDRNELQEM